MSVSKEFLMEAVGLSLLVALLLISMQLFQRAIKITSLLEENQEQQILALEEYEIVKYEGLQIDGLTAINYIKRMTGTYGLPVTVATELGEFRVTERSECAQLRDISSEKYVNPMMLFGCEVCRDENGVITEVKLCMKKEGE